MNITLSYSHAKRELRRAMAVGDDTRAKACFDRISSHLEHYDISQGEEDAMVKILSPFFVPQPFRHESDVFTSAVDVAVCLTLRSSTAAAKMVGAGWFCSLVKLVVTHRDMPATTTSAIFVLWADMLCDAPEVVMSVDWTAVVGPTAARWLSAHTPPFSTGNAIVFLANAIMVSKMRCNDTTPWSAPWRWLVDIFIPRPNHGIWKRQTYLEATGGLTLTITHFGRAAADYILANGLPDAMDAMLRANSAWTLTLYTHVMTHASKTLYVSELLQKAPPRTVMCTVLLKFRHQPHDCLFIVAFFVRRLAYVLRRAGVDPDPMLHGAVVSLHFAPTARALLYHTAGLDCPYFDTRPSCPQRAAFSIFAALTLRRVGLSFVRATTPSVHAAPTRRSRTLFFQP